MVGGGTAGLSVARRLTGSSVKRVLVIEPGPSGANKSVLLICCDCQRLIWEPSTLVTVPGNEYHFIGTDIDWLYNVSPVYSVPNNR